MAISPEVLEQLQQTLQSSDAEDLTSEQLVSILNQGEDEFVSRQDVENARDVPDSVFKEFNRSDIVRNRRQTVTQGAWTDGTSELTSDQIVKSGCQVGETSGKYYFEVWDSDPDSGQDVGAARIQFYVSYGHINGSGSLQISTDNPNALEVTEATYAQYRNVLLDSGEDKFQFGNNADAPEDFYAINIARSRYKEQFDPGNWQLKLKFQDPNDSDNYSTCTLVDEVADTDFRNRQTVRGQVDEELDVLSGSLNLKTTDNPDVIESDNDLLSGTKTYGKFYPQVGIILLNSKALVEHAFRIYQDGPDRNYNDGLDKFVYDIDNTGADPTGDSGWEQYVDNLVSDGVFNDETQFENEGDVRKNIIEPDLGTDSNKKNHSKLFDAIKEGGSFIGRSIEEVNSTHFFVRVRNRDYNFSNNPTFAQSDGSFTNPSFFQDPKVYITTVGLYDDSNTLVAVAKLSKPIQKDFGREALLEIKLSF